MSLLALTDVSKRYTEAEAVVTWALKSVCLTVEAAELVGIWGRRRSGRTTLLSVAAGVEPASSGVVCFCEVNIAQRPAVGMPGGIGYCTRSFHAGAGSTVAEQVAVPLLGRGFGPHAARSGASDALERVGAHELAAKDANGLGSADATRVALARGLASKPRVLFVDQPSAGVPPAAERDAVLDLLKSIAHDDGIAVLMTVDEASELRGADRSFTIDQGELRGEARREPAVVVPFPRTAT